MPVFKNYSQDGRLIESVNEPLSEKNVERFIAEYGEEKARIYLEALADFTKDMKELLRPSERGGRQTSHMVRTNLSTYVHEKELFFKFASLLTSDKQQCIVRQSHDTNDLK